jgi:23S rRNA A2030 N6-methylase RlmJ
LQIELSRIARAETETGMKLRGSGLIVVNAPWTLQSEAQILLPALARVFWPGESSEIRVAPLTTD